MEEDPCAAAAEENKYELGLHVAALFIIMGCSFLGTLLPILFKKFIKHQANETVLNCAKMFGAGVILATSLVHMLGPAIENLTNPCLPSAIAEDYPALALALCLFAILALHLTQLLVSKEIRRQHHNRVDKELKEHKPEKVEEGEKKDSDEDDSHEHAHGEGEHDHSHGHDLMLRKEQHVSTYLLELGIASHSIIVGLTLGVARAEFRTLIIALVFHQFFEGIALSTVVLDAKFKKSFATFFMVMFYTLTTPIGVAIGIGINSSFSENSHDSLLTQGILDALSAGILLYDSLVNILGVHFKTTQFMESSSLVQGLQITTLWIGTGIMALVGRWA
jgi:zinc transporter 1/2/3